MKPEKRQKIMQAAEALFSRARFHEITMEDVARKAGVGKGTLYRYFKDKDDLFLEVALSGFDEMCAMVRSERERSHDFTACLQGVCSRIADFYRSRRQLMHMMQSEERHALWCKGRVRDRWIAKRQQLFEAVEAILEEGRRDGELRGDMDLNVLATTLLGLLRARGQTRRRHGTPIAHETVVELFLHGAAVGPQDGRCA